MLMLPVVEYSGKYGNTWPLNEEMKAVMGNQQIAELLRVDEKLMNAVVSRGCFKRQQLENVTGTPYQKSVTLLDKFRRSDMRNLNCFVQCLAHIQPEVVPLLTGEASKDFKQQMLALECDCIFGVL